MEATVLLHEDFQQHIRYPDSRDKLPLTFPDRGDESTHAMIEYNLLSDDHTLVTLSALDGEEYRHTGNE